MNIPSYYIEGLLTQGTAALARTYLGVTGGGVPEAPVNGQSFARQNATWVVVPPPGISDAPIDGTLYGRLNAAWSAVPSTGISEAPVDGNQYARKNAAWDVVAAGGITDAPSDGSLYARINATWSVVPASVPSARSISTTAPLSGGGDLSANRTLAIAQSDTSNPGYLSAADWNTFNGKLSDAPSNGTTYGRLNGAWSAVPALGFTPENVANKSTGTSLGTSDTSYPSQNAVKVYVDTATNGLDSPAYAASLPLDFLGKPVVTVTLAGNIQFTTTNRTAGYTVTVRIVCDGSNRTFTWPAGWSWLSITPPSGISASKVAVLSITAFGTNDTDVVAAYAVTP
jgi:hypothetical protein